MWIFILALRLHSIFKHYLKIVSKGEVKQGSNSSFLSICYLLSWNMRVETDGDSGPQLGAADVDIYCLGIIVSALSQTQDQGPGPGNQITDAVAPRHGVPGLADYPDQVTIQQCISIFNIDCQHLLHNDVVELDTTTDMYVSCDNKCDYYVNIYL